jgi:DeoR family ulaG and ulaABCDEF operon transcriptional repressor
MLREHRLRKIEDSLARQPFLEVKTLARQLRVSDATVRRDLEALHNAGRLKRTRGGAMPPSQSQTDKAASQAESSTSPSALSTHKIADKARPFAERDTINSSSKMCIGALAATLVNDGQSVMLAGGTTCLALARHLVHHRISVVTNSLPAATLLGGNLGVDVLVTGGMVYSRRDLLIGPHVAHTLSQIHSADLLFLGGSGADSEGFFDSNHWEVEAQRELMARANRVVLLLDSAKFNRRDMVLVAPWDEVDILVTDMAPETSGGAEFARALRAAKVEVMVAGNSEKPLKNKAEKDE